MALKLAVLVSGRGSNLEALARACTQADTGAKIVLVVSNNPDAPGLHIARQAGLATHTIDHRVFAQREAFDRALHEVLTEAKAELICLAGFMRLLTPWFITAWHDRVINIHPSLLPAFPGLNTHHRVIEAGVRITGATVHYVRAQMDAGPILLQGGVPVLPEDSSQQLAARVLTVEHKIYPHAVRLIAQGQVSVHGERVWIKDAKNLPSPLTY